MAGFLGLVFSGEYFGALGSGLASRKLTPGSCLAARLDRQDRDIDIGEKLFSTSKVGFDDGVRRTKAK